MSRHARTPEPGRVDRRTFLKELAIASAAAAAGASLAPELARAASVGGDARGGPVWRKAPCHLCEVGCGLLVAIDDGRAVAVKGDPESPVGRGLACAKGYHAVQSLYGQDRLTRALVRRDGRLAPAPLGEALDLVAARIRDTVARHGKDGVAYYGSAHRGVTDAWVATTLFERGLGTRNVESSARLHAAGAAAALDASFGPGGVPGCYDDIDHADVLVLWNANVAETHPVLFARMLERRRRSPAVRIVVLTTRATRTSYAADRVLRHAPQSEVAIANAICQEIVARKQVHRAFVERHVAFKRGRAVALAQPDDALVPEPVADATWAEYVRFLAAYTPERAQRVTGMPAEGIRWLASLYADRALKVTSVWGEGASRHARGAWAGSALHNVHLLVGKVAAPGDGALCIAGRTGGDALDAGAVAQARPARSDALAMFRALERGDIRFLWVQAANPMVNLPNLGRWRRAAAQADRFVVVSDAYPTPTTDVADVVLPAALWIEREAVLVNGERRAQHVARMIAPPGDATSDGWQVAEVGRRLGLQRLFPWEPQRQVEQGWEANRHLRVDARDALVPFAELRASHGVASSRGDGHDVQWRFNTALDPAADRARGAFDFYLHADHRAWIWLRDHERPAAATQRDFPFRLETGAVLEHSGSGTLTRRIPVLHRAVPRAYVEMHRDDARRLGIRDRETVRLVSPRGALEIEARVDYRSQPSRGTLFAPSFDEARLVALLTSDARCPQSGQPDSGWCAVRVERAGGAT